MSLHPGFSLCAVRRADSRAAPRIQPYGKPSLSSKSTRRFSPPPRSMPTISLSRRGYTARRDSEAGSARGVREGRARNLTHRVRGKWSPSGDPGETKGRRAGPSVCPDKFGGRACVAHKGMGSRSGNVRGGSAPVRPIAVEDDANGRPWLGIVDSLACMVPSEEGRATVPWNAILPERPKSRAQTAERGAGRCHVYIFSRGTAGAPSDAL